MGRYEGGMTAVQWVPVIMRAEILGEASATVSYRVSEHFGEEGSVS
jgi:hypothetical protein